MKGTPLDILTLSFARAFAGAIRAAEERRAVWYLTLFLHWANGSLLSWDRESGTACFRIVFPAIDIVTTTATQLGRPYR